jgi:hypothetical protein
MLALRSLNHRITESQAYGRSIEVGTHSQHKLLAALTHGGPHAGGELVERELACAVGVKMAEEGLQMLLTQLHSTLHQPLLELHEQTAVSRSTQPILLEARTQPMWPGPGIHVRLYAYAHWGSILVKKDEFARTQLKSLCNFRLISLTHDRPERFSIQERYRTSSTSP